MLTNNQQLGFLPSCLYLASAVKILLVPAAEAGLANTASKVTARVVYAPHRRSVTLHSRVACRSSSEDVSSNAATQTVQEKEVDLSKEINKFTKQTASTFAPRPSTATKNPAVKGSTLYYVFEVQAWVALVVGGLLSFNVLLPTDQPDIPRLMGMWSIWMFTVPSLRAKECFPKEKDALNLLFLVIPLLNVTLPLIWKSFPFIFLADVAAVFGVYYWKGVWKEVYGLPWEAPGSAATSAESSDAK